MKESFKKRILKNFVFYVNHEARAQTKLLNFHCRRERCRKRLWEAGRKSRVSILNYHISPERLQIIICGNSEDMTEMVKNAAANTASDLRRSLNIEGPFWRKRFKATLVQKGVHLLRCTLTMDMTMVLQEKCLYPGEWRFSGHSELTDVRKRYRIIDRHMAAQAAGFETCESMKSWYLEHMCEMPVKLLNPEKLTSALAVGDLKYIELIARSFSRRHRRIELIVNDKFGETYGLFVSQKNKQTFTRSLK